MLSPLLRCYCLSIDDSSPRAIVRADDCRDAIRAAYCAPARRPAAQAFTRDMLMLFHYAAPAPTLAYCLMSLIIFTPAHFSFRHISPAFSLFCHFAMPAIVFRHFHRIFIPHYFYELFYLRRRRF